MSRYTPYYCEENVYFLLDADPHQFGDPHALFVTNDAGSVAMWAQRAAPSGEAIVWDYHVVALGRVDGVWHVADLDCTAGPLLTLEQWIEAAFPFRGVIPPELEPSFRVLTADELFAEFRSDRSHMRGANGEWLAPPPPWPPISDVSNIRDFLDTRSTQVPGTVLDLDQLEGWAAAL